MRSTGTAAVEDRELLEKIRKNKRIDALVFPYFLQLFSFSRGGRAGGSHHRHRRCDSEKKHAVSAESSRSLSLKPSPPRLAWKMSRIWSTSDHQFPSQRASEGHICAVVIIIKAVTLCDFTLLDIIPRVQYYWLWLVRLHAVESTSFNSASGRPSSSDSSILMGSRLERNIDGDREYSLHTKRGVALVRASTKTERSK